MVVPSGQITLDERLEVGSGGGDARHVGEPNSEGRACGGRASTRAPRSADSALDPDPHPLGEAEHVLVPVERAQRDRVAPRAKLAAVDPEVPTEVQLALAVRAERNLPTRSR
jgi:hypothetical protein